MWHLSCVLCTSLRDDNGEFYVLVGIVSGNPIGCTDSRVYPDYFTYIGHQNVSGNNNWVSISSHVLTLFQILPWIKEVSAEIQSRSGKNVFQTSKSLPWIMFPNTCKNTLTILLKGEQIYPESLTISSTGAAMEKQYGLLGPYKMVPNLKHNRRPVWKNSLPQLLAQYITQNLTSDQQYLFYNQDLRGK